MQMELPSLDHEWTIQNSWFVRQHNLPVNLKERKDGAVSL